MIAIDEVGMGISKDVPDEFRPYVALWSCALYQALHDAARHRAALGRKGVGYNRDCASAYNWLWSNDDAPTSFLWTCNVLHHDPDRVRDGFLKNWRNLVSKTKELQEEY